MILNTWILGLIVGQLVVLGIFTFGSINAAKIYINWDYSASSERQYFLEKRTYLVAALMKFALLTHIFLFALTALALDEIAPLIIGAMCPVGVLASNSYGFPFLYLKIASVFIFATWLIFNHIDNQMRDYPLVGLKYFYLLVCYPVYIVETVLFFLFVFKLNPMVITSCCGSVFSESASGITGTMSSVPTAVVLISLAVLVMVIILRYALSRKQAQLKLLSALAGSVVWMGFFVVSILAVLSFISVYIYEMPTHHCPFCFMQGEYYYIGFPLYFFLFTATIAGFNRGIVELLKWNSHLSNYITEFQAKLDHTALICMSGFLVTGFLPFVFYYIRTGRLI